MSQPAPSRSLRIRLGPTLREVLGQPVVWVAAKPGLKVEALRQQLTQQYPSLKEALKTVLFVGEGRVLGPEESLDLQGEIAVLHPVAGG